MPSLTIARPSPRKRPCPMRPCVRMILSGVPSREPPKRCCYHHQLNGRGEERHYHAAAHCSGEVAGRRRRRHVGLEQPRDDKLQPHLPRLVGQGGAHSAVDQPWVNREWKVLLPHVLPVQRRLQQHALHDCRGHAKHGVLAFSELDAHRARLGRTAAWPSVSRASASVRAP